MRPFPATAAGIGSVAAPAIAKSDAGGEHAAAVYTLVETAALNGLDPEACLREVLGRIADHPINRIAQRLTWNIVLASPARPGR